MENLKAYVTLQDQQELKLLQHVAKGNTDIMLSQFPKDNIFCHVKEVTTTREGVLIEVHCSNPTLLMSVGMTFAKEHTLGKAVNF